MNEHLSTLFTHKDNYSIRTHFIIARVAQSVNEPRDVHFQTGNKVETMQTNSQTLSSAPGVSKNKQ